MYGIMNSTDDTKPNPPQSDEIESLRSEVDRIDGGILGLLAERKEIAQRIAAVKLAASVPFRDDAREGELLSERIAAAGRYQLDANLIAGVWDQIMADSLRVQHDFAQSGVNGTRRTVVAAIQGIEGSNSHAAAKILTAHADSTRFLACQRFADAAGAVESGRADIAVLPIENTTSGGIGEVYDLILERRLVIVGEVKLHVNHCLLGAAGARIEDLKTIHAHPQAVAQCSEFLAALAGVEIVYASDTALSGRRIAELGDPTMGAIAGEQAAAIHGLAVLKRVINNRQTNYTRFVAVARSPIEVDPQVPAKVSLVLSVSNEPGALSEVLGVFRDEAIPLVKLESRATVNNPWEEMFYLDFEGHVDDPAVVRALNEVRRHSLFLRILGTYPSQDLRPHSRMRPRVHSTRRVPALPEDDVTHEPVDSRYRLASRRPDDRGTVVEVAGVDVGGPDLVVIAGPCAVESLDQVMETARAVKEAGATLLRGGCFKPRTSPYSFQGLGYQGLEMLVEAGRVHGLPIVTEVPAPEHVEKMAEVADVLQIGARNMQNFALLAEVGLTHRPVLLKRGIGASIDELLQAAEYILAGGNQQVILCERGIRTFETSSRSTLDLTAVPVLRRRTHLPIIVDPSHAAGDRQLVSPLAIAAAAIGADGLMLEVHPEPEKALSDGPQALTPDDLVRLMARLGELR
jgi:chorismate mutase/prephenate dehydratase